jgi:hypothetical protein
MRFWLFFLLCFCLSTATAQKNQPIPNTPALTDADIGRLFEKSGSIRWIKRYNGLLDAVISTEIAIGFDGKNCAGYLTYAKSKARFRLEGTLEGNQLRLKELNSRDELTGFVRGTWSDARLEGTWVNYNNTLEAVLTASTTHLSCSSQKWTNRYGTSFKNMPADLLLNRTDEQRLTGTLWSQADNTTYIIRGTIASDGLCKLDVLRADGRPMARMNGKMAGQQPFVTSWESEGSAPTSVRWIFRESFPYDCSEFADHCTALEALFPQNRYPVSNEWFKQRVADWQTRCKAAFARQPESTPLPAHRYALRSVVSTDVVCWNDGVLSGYFTAQDSWASTPTDQTFNFDLRTGRALTLEDFFEKSATIQTWIDDFIKKEKMKVPRFATDQAFRDWLYAEKLNLFLVQRDGLALSTGLHPVFGRVKILIPYTTLKPMLRKEGLPKVW